MEPEEIDKLFRDRLANLPATPSADAWQRLQQKMEPAQKRPVMWIYYAAASVVILLLAGLLLVRQNSGTDMPAVAVETARPPHPDPAGAAEPAVRNQEIAPEAQVKPEVVYDLVPVTQADGGQTAKKAPGFRSRRERVLPDDSKAEILAETTEPTEMVKPALPGAPVVLAADPAPTLAMGAVEVIVKRDPMEAGFDQQSDLRENLARKGTLLKNIYKQARNLKNGEPVELATLGLDKERLNEETKEIKQKIANVISL